MESGVLDTPVEARALNQAFVMAYLLTGSTADSEFSVMKALDSSGLDGGPGELLKSVAGAAVKFPGTGSDEWPLPGELRGVMRLPLEPRRSYVLRILMGLPSHVCGRLLGLNSEEVQGHVSAALQQLPALGRAIESR